jgi:hypothetical protein
MTIQSKSRRDLIHLMVNRESISSEGFADLLDEIVQLEGCGWELGPDPENPERTILAFSALGDQSNLGRIKEEMNIPIVCETWSITIGIPPRVWDAYFQ